MRFEIKGNLTDKIFYRQRHRLNRSNAAKGEDNFAKATDFMMVGYHLNDKLTFLGGKMGQIWGGYEYDENPMYIYQYSDLLDHMDIFHTGFVASYKPVPTSVRRLTTPTNLPSLTTTPTASNSASCIASSAINVNE